MTPKVNKLQYKGKYVYRIQFSDNKEGDVNFQSFLWGEAFESLKDKKLFKKAFIDKTAGTITWPNGVDIAPETIYQKIISTR